jgi:hypothetical protein
MSINLIQINPNLLVEKQLLTFLLNSDDKISKLLIGFETNEEVFYLQNSGNTDMISYIPKSKVDLDKNFQVSDYKLQNMKVGRVISKLFPKDKIIELGITNGDIERKSYRHAFTISHRMHNDIILKIMHYR